MATGTAGPIPGTNLLVYNGGTAIAYSRSCTLNLNLANYDVSSKGSSGWKDILPGFRDWSIDVDGIVQLDSAANLPSLWSAFNGRTRVMLKFSTATSGDEYYHGYAYITSVSVSAPMEDVTTFTCSFAGDSTLTESVKT